MSHRPALVIAAAVLTLAAAGACSTEPNPPADRTRSTVSTVTPGTKTGSGEVRSDLEPLTKRFSALDQPVAATWMSGTLGGDAPGPSTYWIDAVVRVTPETAATMRAASPEPTTETPEVQAGVRTGLPSGQLLTSKALFTATSARSRSVTTGEVDA